MPYVIYTRVNLRPNCFLHYQINKSDIEIKISLAYFELFYYLNKPIDCLIFNNKKPIHNIIVQFLIYYFWLHKIHIKLAFELKNESSLSR